MRILCTDLDNTIIYSYRHDIGLKKRTVELCRGRAISFISERTYELLKSVQQEMMIVPISTRTEEQYSRIDLGTGGFKYALVCNGGVLLADGKREADWYENSLKLIEPGKAELEKALVILEKESGRTSELRFIENLFLFTKCSDPEKAVDRLTSRLDRKRVDVFHKGEKVYVVPVQLSKGNAVMRLREYLDPEYIIAAGDSRFDLSMAEAADWGIVPYGFTKKYRAVSALYEMDKDKLFSEALLEMCLKIRAESIE